MAQLTIKGLFTSLLLLVLSVGVQAQDYSYFHLRGTYSQPHSFFGDRNFSAKDTNGLYAKNGGGFEMEFGHYFNYWGLGGYYSFNYFGMNDKDFRSDYGAVGLQRSGGISSHAFGFGPTFSLPIVEGYWYWHTGLYGGFRIVSTPRELKLEYAPRDNRFTEVIYKGGTRVSGFYSLSTGFSYLFTEKVGLDFNAAYTGGGTNRYNYNYSGSGSKEVEGSSHLNQSVDYLSFQLGLTVKW